MTTETEKKLYKTLKRIARALESNAEAGERSLLLQTLSHEPMVEAALATMQAWSDSLALQRAADERARELHALYASVLKEQSRRFGIDAPPTPDPTPSSALDNG
jgi:hypothetical protein